MTTQSAAASPNRSALVLKGAVALLALSAVVLGVTGYAAVLRGDHVGGYPLMAHMAFSGLFLTLLAGAAIAGPRMSLAGWGAGALWIFLASGFVSSASMVLGMTKWLTADAIATAIVVHRYAGVLALISLGALCVAVFKRK